MKKQLKSNINYATSNFLSVYSLINGYTNSKNYQWLKIQAIN